MNKMSESLADRGESLAPLRKILVWDAPVRVFHWIMVLSFAGAWLTAESERWRLVHVTLGYTMAGLVLFRALWGVWGTRYARFSNFVRGPKAIASYAAGLLRGRHEAHTGHNPAGAVAIVALLSLTLLVALSGWVTYNDLAGHWFEEAHEAVASVMLGLVSAHVAAVLFTSWRVRENLIGAMVTGRKPGQPDQGISQPRRSLAALLLVAVLAFWWSQWSAGIGSDPARNPNMAVAHDRDQDGDDD